MATPKHIALKTIPCTQLRSVHFKTEGYFEWFRIVFILCCLKLGIILTSSNKVRLHRNLIWYQKQIKLFIFIMWDAQIKLIKLLKGKKNNCYIVS